MRILTWLIRAFIFFTLFAFALNNQHEIIGHWFFGAHYLPYFMHPDWFESRHAFMPDPDFARGLIGAVIAACLSSYLGLVLGDAMRKAKR